jgi:tripartite ATP-independent transporter DctM subunit
MEEDKTALASTSFQGVFDRIEAIIGRVIDVIAASLLLFDIVILLWAIGARYLLRAPVTWVEELATVVFLWFGMLGVASALRLGIHMRLSFVVSQLSDNSRRNVETAAHCVLICFLWKLLPLAFSIIALNHPMKSPDLGIPGSVGASATFTSVVLMLFFLTNELSRRFSIGKFLATLLAILVFDYFLDWLGPALMPLGNINLILFFGLGIAVLIGMGIPIAFAFGTATLLYFILTTDLPPVVIVGRINEGMSHFILLTIPLFIFLGAQIQYTGMARRMVDFVATIFAGVRGGLGYVLLCAMYLVSGISGAKAADMAAIGPILAPAMKERGTPGGDVAALLATSAAAAETIPPSLVLIIIGSVCGISIAALFTGGLIPAVVSMLALAVVVYIRSRHEQVKSVGLSGELIFKAFIVAIPGLALPFLIRAAVLGGVATATEVAVLGVLYVFIVGLITMRMVSFGALGKLLIDAAAMSGAVTIIIAFAGAMSWALTQSGFAQTLVEFMTHLPGGKFSFFAVSILAFIILGSVLEGIPAIVLFGPLLFPSAAALGIHQVHYAIVVLLSMGLGLFAPPFGYGYYASCAITKVSPDHAMKSQIPYLVAFGIAIVIIAAIPWLSIGFL